MMRRHPPAITPPSSNHSGIKVELTSTPRVGVHRYTFPAGGDANIHIDAGAVIQTGHAPINHNSAGAISTGGFIEFISDRELIGRSDFRGGWGHNFPYSVYFYARFDIPATFRRVADAGSFTMQTFADGPGCKAIAGFGTTQQVNMQVGISYVSIAKARASVDRETAGRSFEDIREQAADIGGALWAGSSPKAARPISARSSTRSSPASCACPAIWASTMRIPCGSPACDHFTDYYCLWDSVRNANSLLTLFDPDQEAALLNCLLDVANHIGWIPDAWIAGHGAMIQGGSSADILLCEAGPQGCQGHRL